MTSTRVALLYEALEDDCNQRAQISSLKRRLLDIVTIMENHQCLCSAREDCYCSDETLDEIAEVLHREQ